MLEIQDAEHLCESSSANKIAVWEGLLPLHLWCLEALWVMCWGGVSPHSEHAVADEEALVLAEVTRAAGRYGCNQRLLVLLAPSSCRRLRTGAVGVILGCPVCDKVRKENWVGGRGAELLPMHREKQLPKPSSH